MKPDKLWLPATCFCHMPKWNLLLKQFEKFISLLNDVECLFYSIQFDYVNGENIRFSILTIEDKLDSLAAKMDIHFNCFFKENIVNGRLEIKSIFLPFPTATIQFGLFNIDYNEKLTSTYRKKQNFAALLIKALSVDEITKETIITFTFYLHISFLNECWKQIASTNNVLANLTQNRFYKKNCGTVMEIVSENQNLISEITNEILHTEKFDGELVWLNCWISSSIEAIEECVVHCQSVDESSINYLYQNEMNFIHTSLGLSQETRDLIFDLVNKAVLRVFEKGEVIN